MPADDADDDDCVASSVRDAGAVPASCRSATDGVAKEADRVDRSSRLAHSSRGSCSAAMADPRRVGHPLRIMMPQPLPLPMSRVRVYFLVSGCFLRRAV